MTVTYFDQPQAESHYVEQKAHWFSPGSRYIFVEQDSSSEAVVVRV